MEAGYSSYTPPGSTIPATTSVQGSGYGNHD